MEGNGGTGLLERPLLTAIETVSLEDSDGNPQEFSKNLVE